MARVVVRLNDAALREFTRGRNGAVVGDLVRRADRVVNRAKQLSPVHTGRLRSSITREVVVTASGPVARAGTNVEYARWVHEGTGIYGPRGQPIRPVRAKVLVFTPKGANRPVFARQVRGARPRRFLTEALPAAAG